jgi:hypothetical protein
VVLIEGSLLDIGNIAVPSYASWCHVVHGVPLESKNPPLERVNALPRKLVSIHGTAIEEEPNLLIFMLQLNI